MEIKKFLAEKRNLRTVGIIIGVLILVIVVLKIFFPAERSVVEEGKPVRVEVVKPHDLKEILHFTGDIKGQEEVTVFPKVTGKLIENTVYEGDEVRKGDVLAYIDRDETGFRFPKSPVESPIDGTVGRLYLDKGTNITSQKAIALISDMSNVKVKIHIVERDVPKVKKSQTTEVRVDAYPGKVFSGIITKLSPIVDLQSRTAHAEITIPNPEIKLRSGMFARVQIVVDERNEVAAIPWDIVTKDDLTGKTFVFTVNGDVAYRSPVILGLREGNWVEIVEGISAGDQIVTAGRVGLADSEKIRIIKTTEGTSAK